MGDKFEVKLAFDIQRGGEPYCDGQIVYHNMDYADVAMVEEKAIGLLGSLNDEAKARVEAAAR